MLSAEQTEELKISVIFLHKLAVKYRKHIAALEQAAAGQTKHDGAIY